MTVCICRGTLHCMPVGTRGEGSRGADILVKTNVHLLFSKKYSWWEGSGRGDCSQDILFLVFPEVSSLL